LTLGQEKSLIRRDDDDPALNQPTYFTRACYSPAIFIKRLRFLLNLTNSFDTLNVVNPLSQ
ncbi:MAG: hypothetical protein AAFO06_24985, partial [Cyanobacteria bacterium J06597_16]